MSTFDKKSEEIRKAKEEVREASKALDAAKMKLVRAEKDLYRVAFVDINAMELSHLQLKCNGITLACFEYGWDSGMTTREAVEEALTVCLEEGTLVLAKEVNDALFGF